MTATLQQADLCRLGWSTDAGALLPRVVRGLPVERGHPLVARVRGSGMAGDRDVAAFGRRALAYDEGWRGALHHQIADRTAGLALACVPAPRRILDVGCGTQSVFGNSVVAARRPDRSGRQCEFTG